MLPAYSNLLDKLTVVKQVATIYALGQKCTLFTGKLPDSDVDVITIKNNALYGRKDESYTANNNIDWPKNALRFGVLSRVTSLLTKKGSPLNCQSNIVHCNDWQSRANTCVY
ncbi:MAG: starch synthase [Methylophilaceae bacterium]